MVYSEPEFSNEGTFPQALMRRYQQHDGPHMVTGDFMKLVTEGLAFEIFYKRTDGSTPVVSKRGSEEACMQVMDAYEYSGVYCIYEDGKHASV